jgi:hypothetical protein
MHRRHLRPTRARRPGIAWRDQPTPLDQVRVKPAIIARLPHPMPQPLCAPRDRIALLRPVRAACVIWAGIVCQARPLAPYARLVPIAPQLGWEISSVVRPDTTTCSPTKRQRARVFSVLRGRIVSIRPVLPFVRRAPTMLVVRRVNPRALFVRLVAFAPARG